MRTGEDRTMTGRGRDLRGDLTEGAGIAANQAPVPGDSAVWPGPVWRVRDRPLRAGLQSLDAA